MAGGGWDIRNIAKAARAGVAGNLGRAAKVACASLAAIAIAQAAGLSYAVSAGVITLLSLQATKRETLSSALRRALSFALAIALVYACFGALGFTLASLGAFLFLFVLLSYAAGLADMVAVCAVLASHFWSARDLSLPFLRNEALVVLVGVGVAVLFNLFLRAGLASVRRDQALADAGMKSLLALAADCIKEARRFPVERVDALRADLRAAVQRARRAQGNSLSDDLGYFADYFEMRLRQLELLGEIAHCANELEAPPGGEDAERVVILIRNVAWTFDETNDGELTGRYHGRLSEALKATPLPRTRAEFESSAILFQVLVYMREFIQIKAEFTGALPQWAKDRFWGKPAPPRAGG
jgi:uncharacterized membrane protein YgaE (UPF0421/DUF939 family)